MAFKRTETTLELLDLTRAAPEEVERRIIDGVRRYANNAENWSHADKNTPFLGHIIGMGIESANLVDITMSIERQFLTRKTKRVPVGEDGSAFRLEDGELGKLVILEGQDSYAATPGLAVQMLMTHGHMPLNEPYLKDTVSFPYVVIIGEGYRLMDALRKLLGKVEKIQDPQSRAEAVSNLGALVEQAKGYVAALADPATLARQRREAFAREKSQVEQIERDLEEIAASLREVSATSDAAALEQLRAKQVALKLRLNTSRVKLRVSEEVARHSGLRTAVEDTKVEKIRDLLLGLVKQAAGVLPSLDSASAAS
ncbi:MAG TPA: hypothetical protein VIE39_00225 [Thermoanaerobaculia bacterium]|jgi:hypothetical protein